MTFKEKTKKHINNNKAFQVLEQYVEIIEEKNKVMNLTGFSGDRLWEEGIYESLVSLEIIIDSTTNKKILDVGAGVGFPSIPFKIVYPEIQLTIFESSGKRVDFLNEVSDKLNLNIDVQNIRVEKSEISEYFDFITARAVSELKVIIEASSKLGKINSTYCFIKGPKFEEEIKNANKIINNLKIKVKFKKVFLVETKEVYVVYFKKTKETPKKYPRDWTQIIKK